MTSSPREARSYGWRSRSYPRTPRSAVYPHKLKTALERDERRTDKSRWNLVVGGETDRSVRSYLARTGGKKGDLSRFV
ncbi:MAG: hypothetical protein F4Z74_00730 [Acidobacteria bacterium]|nr:hypothetical protein [Acidobacteriota bacterium]